MPKPVSAAVISGGLDCKLIHWDVSCKRILGSRQAGMQCPWKYQSLASFIASACGSTVSAAWSLVLHSDRVGALLL